MKDTFIIFSYFRSRTLFDMARDIIKEIKSIKQRKEYNSRLDFSSRLETIQTLVDSFTANPNTDYSRELLKYIPIATVACFEAFFRSAVKEMVDFGQPFIRNVAKFNQTKNIRFDFELVTAIHEKTITIGELVSHMLSYNNIDDINSNLSTILEKDFLQELKQFENHSKFDGRNDISSVVCSNYSQVLNDIKRIYELRHIFCHEFGLETKVDKDEILRCFSNSKMFLNHVNFYIWHTLYPNYPETQAEMNEQAVNDFNIEEDKFQLLSGKIRAHLDDEINVQLYDEAIDKWIIYREAKAKLNAAFVDGGTLYPLIYYTSMRITTKEKIDSLANEYEIDFKLIIEQ